MLTAEDIFTDTWRRYLSNWNVIISLRKVASVARPQVEQELAAQHATELAAFAEAPRAHTLILNRDGTPSPLTPELQSLIQQGATATALTQANLAVDAGSLVFAQSIVDDCAMSYCRVCALAKPEDWDGGIGKRSLDYQTAMSKSKEEIRSTFVESKLKELERESLLKKIDTLFVLCKPPKDFAPLRNYTYDRDRLEEIDNKRHRIIHENAFAQLLEEVEEDLDYLFRTVNFMMALVHNAYGVQISEFRLMTGMQPKNSE